MVQPSQLTLSVNVNGRVFIMNYDTLDSVVELHLQMEYLEETLVETLLLLPQLLPTKDVLMLVINQDKDANGTHMFLQVPQKSVLSTQENVLKEMQTPMKMCMRRFRSVTGQPQP
jgi:hypothetical protein